MEYIDLFEIIPEVLSFIGAKNAQREANQGPHMNHRVVPAVMFRQLVDLGMAVMASGYAVICTSGLDLIVFEFTVLQTFFFKPGLEESSSSAAAVVVGAVGLHVNEVFFTHNGFYDKSQVFGNGVAIAFSDDLTGILHGELDP